MKGYNRTNLAVCAVLAVALFVIIPGQSFAAEDGMIASTDLALQVSTRPEAKVSVTQSFIFPALQGGSPLTEGNNVKTGLTFEVTPVSLAGLANVVFTPIAFIEISGGGKIGTGWNMALGNGIGLNVPIGLAAPGSVRKSEISGSAFSGLQWSAWAGGAFQFDLAAVMPGDWNHVIFRAYSEMKYSAFTKAGSTDSWIIENDDGENMNGWTSYSSFVLGYQMPLSPILDFVGFMAEMDINLYDVSTKANWGGNKGRFIYSGLFNFSLTEQFGTSMIVQMRTRRNYNTSDYENADNLWYQDQLLSDKGGSSRLVFYRAALIFNWKIF